MTRSFVFMVAAIILLSTNGVCPAQIYKYKDNNGNWVFTDSPPAGVENMESMDGVSDPPAAGKDLRQWLQDKYRPGSEIEKASLATMTVHTPAGSGSGFFISPNGYIITNKHVIRGSARDVDRHKQDFTAADKRIDTYQNYISDEREQLEKIKNHLSDYKIYLGTLKNSAFKKNEETNYKVALKDYENRKKRFHQGRRDFERKKKAYEQQKSDFYHRTRAATMAKNFRVILKDGSEHPVYLVAESKSYDLALLKLDRFTTPFLRPLNFASVHQGMPVYAIGSPIGLKDSVSSGIVSGTERGYIKTNAQIYPGNSGGPLVVEEGRVIGINTMKELTRKFEGLGFAIPVGLALQEFGKFIRP